MNHLNYNSFGISVITVTLNHKEQLRTTIDSVQCFIQNNHNVQIEHVIIDGNSIDGTKQFLMNHKFPCLFSLSENDNGIYEAMNKGVKIARFDYVIFVNAGDTIELLTLENSLIQLFKNGTTEEELAGFAFSVIYKLGISVRKVISRQVKRSNPKMPGIHQGMLYKRNRLLDMPFDPSYKICGDYEQFARMFSNGYIFKPINRYFSTLYAGGISTNKPFKLYLESSKVTKKYFKIGIIYNVKSRFNLILALSFVQIILLYSNIFIIWKSFFKLNNHQHE